MFFMLMVFNFYNRDSMAEVDENIFKDKTSMKVYVRNEPVMVKVQ